VIGEIIQFERNSKLIKGLVFCYMPTGGPEMKEAYLKAYLIDQQKVNHNNIHMVKLSDPTLETLTLDREVGAIMGIKYASSSTHTANDN